MHIEKLGRQHLQVEYRCEASNNNITDPIKSSTMLEINRKCFLH